MVSCKFNSTDSRLCVEGEYIISSDYSESIRNYFTIAFTVFQTLIPLIGALALKRLNQRRALTQDGKVPFTLISSWLSVPSALLHLFKTRRLPGRYWGLIMLLIGLFSWATHFLVNAITYLPMAGLCDFEQGIVVDTIHQGDSFNSLVPPPFWTVSTWSISSQRASFDNRGELNLTPAIGISRKANNDTDFYATDDDLLGGWECNPTDASESNRTIDNNLTTMASQVINNGLVYPFDSSSELLNYEEIQDKAEAVLVWSPTPDSFAWDVKAAMASKINTTNTSFIVNTLHCTLKSNSSTKSNFTNILQVMDSVRTLVQWAPAALGVLKDSPEDPDFYKTTLELYLNAMVMATGSNNTADATPLTDDDWTYNCIIYKTRIPIVTVVAVVIELALLSFLILIHSVLFLRVRFRHDYKKVEHMPSSVMELQLAFIRQLENDTEHKITPRHLGRYVYGFDKERDMMRFQHRNSAPVHDSQDQLPDDSSPSSPEKPAHGTYEPVPSDMDLDTVQHLP